MSFWGYILDGLERRLLLRSLRIDKEEAGKLTPPDKCIHNQLVEVKTTSGWRVWRRGDCKIPD